MVSPVQISRVTDVTEFIKAICISQPEAIDSLTDIINLLYSVVPWLLFNVLGMVSPVQISRVTDITEFIKAICISQPEAIDGLTDIINLLYSVVQR